MKNSRKQINKLKDLIGRSEARLAKLKLQKDSKGYKQARERINNLIDEVTKYFKTNPNFDEKSFFEDIKMVKIFYLNN